MFVGVSYAVAFVTVLIVGRNGARADPRGYDATMPVIVRHKESHARYVLLGAGFGAYKTSRPGLLFGNWGPSEESGDKRVVLVSNADGEIGWIESELLEVESIDGQTAAAVLGESV